jgi:hypothetical protein
MTDLGWTPLRSRAVLIGTASYQHLPPVGPVANSLDRMRRVLTSDLCGWPADRISIFSDIEKPGDLPDELVELFADAEDVALFYYVGHGLVDDSDNLCLCLVNTRVEASRRRTTSLPFYDVRHAFRQSQAKTKIVILDCCYAGMAERRTLGHEALVDRARADGTFTMGAAGEFGLAWYETDPTAEQPQTYFTKYLLDVIENGIEGTGENLRLDIIFREAQAALEVAGKPVPTSTARHRAPNITFARNARSGQPFPRRQPHPVASFPITIAAEPYWRPDPDDLSAAARRLNRAAAELHERVRQFLNDELAPVLKRPLDTRWSTAVPALMGSWENIHQRYRSRATNVETRTTGPVDLAGGTVNVLTTIDRVASGRLAFIGPAGSGKTVALRLAARQLAAHSALHGGPIPLPLDLAGWDPHRQTLKRWITDEMRSRWDVRVPPYMGIAVALLDAGLIYPVFDSLDAMPAGRQATAFQQIPRLRMPFLLACRTEEFAAEVGKSGPLTATAVVELQPVSVKEVVRYLGTLSGREDLQVLSTNPTFPDNVGELDSPRMVAFLRSAQPAVAESVFRIIRSNPDSIGDVLLRSAWWRFRRDVSGRGADALTDAARRMPETENRFAWQWCAGRRSNRGWLKVAVPMAFLVGLATTSTATDDWSGWWLQIAGAAAMIGLAVAALCTRSGRMSVRTTWTLAGAILGGTIASPIAFGGASPQYRNLVPDSYGNLDPVPVMSVKDWPGAVVGAAIVTAGALVSFVIGSTKLIEFVTMRAKTPQQSMVGARKSLIFCFFGVAVLAGALMGLLSWNLYYVPDLAWFQGSAVGALVGFLTALGVESEIGILRARSSGLGDVLRLAEQHGLIRQSGVLYEFTDARLAAIIRRQTPARHPRASRPRQRVNGATRHHGSL